MNGHKYDAITNTLMISRAFEKRAKNPNTTEYALYYKFRTDMPDARIIVDGKNKAQRDVSTKEMESYIKKCNNPVARLKEFNRQMVFAKVQKHPIKYMQNWFHENYANYSDSPEYKDGFVIVKTIADMEAEEKTAAVPDASDQIVEDKKNPASDDGLSSASPNTGKIPSEIDVAA